MKLLMNRRSLCAVAMLAAVVVLSGCGAAGGPETQAVNGTLTINGQPANNLTITFSPLDPSQTAASGPVTNGEFKLFSGSEGKPGAGVGKYKVVLAVASSAAASQGSPDAAAYGAGAGAPKAETLPFPEKYKSVGTSDKEVEVTAGTNNIAIDIEG